MWTDLPGIRNGADPQFASDFIANVRALAPGASDAQLQQAIVSSSWYGRLGSGSNPYVAAYEVVERLGAAPTFDQGQADANASAAVARSPEGLARNDQGGNGNLLGTAGGITGAYFGGPLGAAAGAGLGTYLGGGSSSDTLRNATLAAALTYGGNALFDNYIAGSSTLGGEGAALGGWDEPLTAESLRAAGIDPASLGYSVDPVTGALSGSNTALFGAGALGGAALGAAGGALASGGLSGAAAGTAAGAAAGATTLSKILSGEGKLEDVLKVLGQATPAALGAYAANEQTQALRDLANQEMAAQSSRFQTLLSREDEAIAKRDQAIAEGKAVGAPYRERLSALYADPTSFLSSPEVQIPVQLGSDALAHSLSVRGNPYGSPNAKREIEEYAAKTLFGRLGEEKNRLATLGGIPQFNAAGSTVPGTGTSLAGMGTQAGFDTAAKAIGANAGVYNALGYGAGQIFKPPSTLADLLKQMKSANDIFSYS